MKAQTQLFIDLRQTKKLKTVLADETDSTRPELDNNRHTDRSHRFRIPRGNKTTQYLRSFIPAAIRVHKEQADR